MSDRVTVTIDRGLIERLHLLQCSDVYCVLRERGKPRQGTNGGCTCFEHERLSGYGPNDLRRALRDLVSQVMGKVDDWTDLQRAAWQLVVAVDEIGVHAPNDRHTAAMRGWDEVIAKQEQLRRLLPPHPSDDDELERLLEWELTR